MTLPHFCKLPAQKKCEIFSPKMCGNQRFLGANNLQNFEPFMGRPLGPPTSNISRQQCAPVEAWPTGTRTNEATSGQVGRKVRCAGGSLPARCQCLKAWTWRENHRPSQHVRFSSETPKNRLRRIFPRNHKHQKSQSMAPSWSLVWHPSSQVSPVPRAW